MQQAHQGPDFAGEARPPHVIARLETLDRDLAAGLPMNRPHDAAHAAFTEGLEQVVTAY